MTLNVITNGILIIMPRRPPYLKPFIE